MLINSYILAENIEGVQSKSLHSDPMKASLTYVTVLDAQAPLFSDCAYVAEANALEVLTPPVSPYVIISIGEAPRRFTYDPNCDLICCRSTFSIHVLISIVHDVFKKFNEWEQALILALVEEKPLGEFCRLSLPIFRTPVIVYSSSLEILGIGEEGNIYRLPDEFSKSDCDFLPVEYGESFCEDPKFFETFNEKLPQVYKAINSGVSCLYTNIFIDDVFVARIVIEHIMRETNEGDWLPINILANYVRNCLLHSKFNHYGNLLRLKHMIKNDILGDEIVDRKKLEMHMKQIRWQLDDSYLCVVIEPYISGFPEKWTQYEGSFLEIMFDGCITFEQLEKLLLICNLRVSGFSMKEFITNLEASLNKHQMMAGVSTEFNNFYNLPAFHTQALVALKTGKRQHSLERIFYFPEIALDYVLANGIFSLPHIALIPDVLWKMMEYDKLKNSEYCKTLTIFLEQNMNIEKTIEKLHIHRSTFKYRLERIHTMLPGVDFYDHRVRLYYQLMFEVLKTV